MTTYIDNKAPVALVLKNISLTVQDGENKRTILDAESSASADG